jgi:hypothetical protein
LSAKFKASFVSALTLTKEQLNGQDIYIYIYIDIYRERERRREGEKTRGE